MWRKEPDPEKPGRFKKMPYIADLSSLKPAKSNDPTTWGSYDAARETQAHRGFDGVMFAFSPEDDFAGVDLDDCRNPETSALEPWAQQLITVLQSYTEVSPSGTGVKVWLRGKLPGEGKGIHRDPLEVYDRKRFFTVTGNHVDGTPLTVEERQPVLDDLRVAVPIIAKALELYGERFSLQFAGRWRETTKADGTSFDNDESDADLSFCNMLVGAGARTRDDCLAVIRLSGLSDEKWERDDYQKWTIGKALAGKGTAARTLAHGDMVCLADVEPVAVDWLWKPYLPLGKLVSLEGDMGTGKSTLAAKLAAHVTTGRPFPEDIDTKREPGIVLYLQSEDGLADTLRPRLEAVGADLTRVRAISFEGVTVDDPRLGQAIATYQPALVIIDPLQDYMKPKTNINQENEVRAVLRHLRSLAETYTCTILCVRHFGKDQEKKDIHRAIGSVAFSAVMRSILQVEPGRETNLFTLKHTKTNIGPFGKPLAYRIVPINVPLSDGGHAETSCIEWTEQALATEVLMSAEIIQTIEALAKLGGAEVALGDVARVLGLQPPTTHARLEKAVKAGLVVQPTHGKYTLTTQLRGV
jgi:hypothetical protein